ncbi:MAG: glycoside hydrolase family 43 protein, partial [Gordonia sp. (in: high G+C Gram-positive bacteria)]|uniref:glycoside hydrolase family 43 protein n=1 Tax=Gordonia sp. (in: high G+C Gram-positive bacteria) TaxID=84139 RepID=UPI003BB75E3B
MHSGNQVGQSSPAIPGFFPDPSVCLHGDRLLLVNSSFEYFPGIPLHESPDGRGWALIGNVLNRREQVDLRAAPSNGGIYAATIRERAGQLFVITTDIDSVRAGQLLFTAVDPAGPWSTPMRVAGAVGIDPDLFWDADGTCRVSWKRIFDDQPPAIVSAPIDPATGQLLGPAQLLWQGVPGLASAEGPHLYRRADYYYCLLAQGGTERGHCVVVARARSLDGPWESCPDNPILTHRSTDLPVQNVGHADLFERPDGSWGAAYLGVRPRGMVPKYHVNGRETFLADVEWVDDWPRLTTGSAADDTPAAYPATNFFDDFPGRLLHPRWISPGGTGVDTVSCDSDPGIELRPTGDESSARPGL